MDIEVHNLHPADLRYHYYYYGNVIYRYSLHLHSLLASHQSNNNSMRHTVTRYTTEPRRDMKKVICYNLFKQIVICSNKLQFV